MTTWIKVGEIDEELCDTSLKNYLFNFYEFLAESNRENNLTKTESDEGSDLNELYDKLINSSRYHEIRNLLIENQKNYLLNSWNDVNIFESELSAFLIESLSDYYIFLTHEGMCNIMYYIFYDVYCSKKEISKIEGYAENHFFNSELVDWKWNETAIFPGIKESNCYEVNSELFWSNFSREVVSKIGATHIKLIGHRHGVGKKVFNIYKNGFFIIDLNLGPPDEPWHAAMSSYLLSGLDEKVMNSKSVFLSKNLYSKNELPDFYKWEKKSVRLDSSENLYYPEQRKAYGVFQKLKELGICTKSILSGTVTKSNKQTHELLLETNEYYNSDRHQNNKNWNCNICGGDEDSGCLFFDPSECPKFS